MSFAVHNISTDFSRNPTRSTIRSCRTLTTPICRRLGLAEKMDPDLIDPNLVFAKTAPGEEAMLQRTRVVQRNIRMVLILVDGNATVAELCDKTGNAQITQDALLELESDGFIERRVEENSVWRHGTNAEKRKRLAGIEQDSGFSTPGENPASGSMPPRSLLSNNPETRSIPFPESRSSRPSLTPDPAATTSHSLTVFHPRSIPETPAAPPPPPGLRDRLQTLLRRHRTTAPTDGPIRRRSLRQSLTWPISLLIGLLTVAAALFVGVLFFPYAAYLPEFETAIGQTAGRAVTVGAMRVTVFPKPALLLEELRFAGTADSEEIRIPALRLQPAVGTLLSSKILFREAELSGLSLSAQTLTSLARMLESATRPTAPTGVLQVSLAGAEISFAELAIGDLSGDFKLSDDRRLESISLRSADRKLQVRLEPTASGITVQMDGLAWRPAQGSPYLFDSLELKGEIAGPDFTISALEARIFDGLVRLATVLHANRQVSMTGEMTFERINAQAFGEALGMGPQFEGESRGNLKFSATADNWPAILSALQASGDFSIRRGSLGSIDLPEAVRRGSTTPLTLGGQTRFEELTGAITLTPSASRFSRLSLDAGLMHSSGQIEVTRNRQLQGRMEVQMRGRADRTTMSILISGPLNSPRMQTATD